MGKISYIIKCIKATSADKHSALYYVCEEYSKICAIPLHRFKTFLGIILLGKLEESAIITNEIRSIRYDGIENDRGKVVEMQGNGKYVSIDEK